MPYNIESNNTKLNVKSVIIMQAENEKVIVWKTLYAHGDITKIQKYALKNGNRISLHTIGKVVRSGRGSELTISQINEFYSGKLKNGRSEQPENDQN